MKPIGDPPPSSIPNLPLQLYSSHDHKHPASSASGPRPPGGRRPGAGAPKRNTNAVKTGRGFYPELAEGPPGSARPSLAEITLTLSQGYDPIFLNAYLLLVQAARREKQINQPRKSRHERALKVAPF